MFGRFALCLAPLIVTWTLFLLFGDRIADMNNPEGILGLGIVLVGVGALLSGFFVGRLVYRGISDPIWLKWLVSILIFLLVAIGYAGLGLFSGCMLFLVNAK